MPKQKQPTSLRKLAFNFLVTHFAHSCDKLSATGFLALLRQEVNDVREYIRDHVPGPLFAEFCRRFLDTFYSIGAKRSENRPGSHYRAVLEMIMDVEIVGLVCEGRIIRYLDMNEAHRLKGLKVLDWTEPQRYESVARGLTNFWLQDLTTFIFPRMCTDIDLQIIGQCCAKLQMLKIEGSENVTDQGLCALRPCSDLRIINFHYCSVSDDGVNQLLNVHRKLEEFNVGDYYTIGEECFNILSRSISLVCPSVKRFALKSDPVTNNDLHSVVALFPNLNHIEFCSSFTGDLRILKDLKNLKRLDFGYSSGDFSIENLKQLLSIVGYNIHRLTLRSNIPVTQNDLNFIFKTCANIECLHFGYKPHEPIEKLVIPPFQKLKYLDCTGYPSHNNRWLVLQFGQMLNLETLRVQYFDAIFQMTESIILDNIRFPNLREVRTFHNYHNIDIIDRITQIARNKNLDFALVFSQ